MIQPISYSVDIRKAKKYISVKRPDVILECHEAYTGYDKHWQDYVKRVKKINNIVSEYV